MSTPSLTQYLEVKKQYKDCMVFYRMGDFYELFFEDAIKAASLLSIVLTKRGKYQDKDVPMCGLPFHSSEHYINKLVNLGYKIAICEQLETPEEAKRRGYKSVIKREVVRVITPGTLTDDVLLNAKSENYILCLVEGKNNFFSLSWADISTQKFYFDTVNLEKVEDLLLLISPSEILISENTYDNVCIARLLKSINVSVTKHACSLFDVKRSENILKSFYKVSVLDGIAKFSEHELISVGALMEYIISTQLGNLSNFVVPTRYFKDEFISLDSSTIKSLEILKSNGGEHAGSLISTIDFTLTASGARFLKSCLLHPLTSLEKLNNRLDLVDFFLSHYDLRRKIREILSNVYDFERCLSRISLNRAEPRDLVIIKESLKNSSKISLMLEQENLAGFSSLKSIYDNLGDHTNLVDILENAVYDHANKKNDPYYIKEEFDPKLLQIKCLVDNSEKTLFDLSVHYRQITGVSSLKISSNNLIGYYVEVPSSYKLNPSMFIHKQSLTNVVRYTTSELKELEYKILSAKESYTALELKIFGDLCTKINESAANIRNTVKGIARLDVIISFSEMAAKLKLVRPKLSEDTVFLINGGRHLVVESKGDFIPNNLHFTEKERICLLTGPNMAGKSTYLRQNALIAIMAQIGSFVPANSAHIGLIDKIFTRIGAADNISAGRSTFMVEMIETATIVNLATERSFVILDEVGRGTSTCDGVSIAHAVIEYLHNVNQCRTIFATHYHELCKLENFLHYLKCYTMKVLEWEGNVVFMHEVVKGHSDKSYGIHVANLSGIPKPIISRALELLDVYESEKGTKEECTV